MKRVYVVQRVGKYKSDKAVSEAKTARTRYADIQKFKERFKSELQELIHV